MLSVPPKEIPGDVISGEPIGFRGKYGRGSAKIRRQERRISILGTDGYSIRMTVGMQAGENQTIQDADAQRAEAVFRECLSRAAMRRLNASDPVEISGRSVRTMRREPDGQRYLSLGDLCAALGASLQWNGGAFRAAVTRAGTTAVIPLAASEVKVGDEWKALPALVLYDGQTIWVPVEMSELLMTE